MKHRIAEITERHNQMVQKPYRIEMSIGICEVACTKDLDIEEVLEQADKKLYIEKKAKKEKQKNVLNVNWQISLVSAIKQSQNGKGVMVSQKYHCYFHFAMN